MTNFNSTPKRYELRELLNSRRRAYLKLNFADQQLLDSERLVPVLELHRILDHYYEHGLCPDERESNGNDGNDDGDRWNLVSYVSWNRTDL